jgi:hypothetical protein
MLHIWGNGNIHEIYGWKTRREDPSLDSKTKLKQILTEIQSDITTLLRKKFIVKKSDTGIGFSPGISVFSCRYFSTKAPYVY